VKDDVALGSALLSPSEVGRRLAVSTVTVRRLIRSGDLPAVKVGSQLRVDPSELRRWLFDEDVLPSRARDRD
jgi:excisionase family DNA binding protein